MVIEVGVLVLGLGITLMSLASGDTAKGRALVGDDASVSDLQLLQRVARRDQAAFVLFFKRHERALFGLALHLVRNREVAEEIVQEAMIRIWLSAANFRPDGNLRGWITSILVREFLKKRRQLRKVCTESLESRCEMIPSPAVPAQAGLESRDSMQVLRGLVSELPEDERQIVGLYFGAGYTQVEISRALAIPQSTVSRQLKQALELLRSRMKGLCGGLGGLAVTPELFAQLILEQSDPPAALAERVLIRLTKAGGGANGAPVRIWVRRTVQAGSLLVGVGVLLLAAGRTAEVVPGGEEAAAPGRGGAESGAGRVRACWTFERGIPSELKVFLGSWAHWEPGRAGLAPAAVAGLFREHAVYLELPLEVPPVPLRVRIKARVPAGYFRQDRSIGAGLNIFWMENKFEPASAVNLIYRHRYSTRQDEVVHHEMFLYKAWIVGMIKEAKHLARVAEYDRPFPSRRLVLVIHGYAVEEILVEQIEVEQLPDYLKDPQKLRDLMKAERGDWLNVFSGNAPEPKA